MQQLPDALRPLEAYEQFLLWKLSDGIKLPINYRTAHKCNAHDPAMWTDAQTALSYANLYGPEYGVAFAFTADDPFYFLDIDHCAVDGQWSELALKLMALLPGAAVEVSTSGEGLHLFGQGVCPPHSCKNVPLGIELYTQDRFVALTGNVGDGGSAAVDNTAGLQQLVDTYFPPRGGVDGDLLPVAWTIDPVPEWNGHTTDDSLIKAACSSRSAKSAFGGGASFNDLWTRNVPVLSEAFQSDASDKGDYDESSADAALAQHLAFWTGKNCERIERLMMRSSLVRDKWTKRDDYLRMTIINAVSMQKDVHTKQGVERERVPIEEIVVATTEQPLLVNGYQFMGVMRQLEYFKGCVYVQSMHAVFTPKGAMLNPQQFNATYGGYVFQMEDNASGKTTRKAWEAFVESQAIRYPKADTITFRPDLGVGVIFENEGWATLNTYVPVITPYTPGDPEPFLNHVRKLVPDENDRAILLAYLAACIQHKGVKFQWCPLIQGVEGNGKSLISRVIAAAVGNRYSHSPKAADIDNKFNGWMLNKLFIMVEDVYVPAHKSEVIEALKPMITNPWQDVQLKGKDQVTMDVCANFVLNTNHKDAIRKTHNDRRFCVFFTAQQEKSDLTRDGMVGSYFPDLYNWLRAGGYGIVHHYLANYPIPDALNPAGFCDRAPVTTSTNEAVAASAGGIEQELYEAINEGRIGFCGGWVSSMAFDRLLDENNMKRFLPINKRRKMLEDLGYIYHPNLKDGRSSSIVPFDGGRPRLFIKKDHRDTSLSSPSDIVSAFIEAQKMGGGDIVPTTRGLPYQS